MAEAGGFKLSSCTLEDKLEYKKLVKGQKKTAKKD